MVVSNFLLSVLQLISIHLLLFYRYNSLICHILLLIWFIIRMFFSGSTNYIQGECLLSEISFRGLPFTI